MKEEESTGLIKEEEGVCAKISPRKLSIDPKKLTDYGGLMTLFKSFVGIGVITMPSVNYNSGLLSVPIVIIFCGIVTYYYTRNNIVIQEKRNFKVKSYTEFVESILGKGWGIFTAVLIIIGQFGVTVAYSYFFLKMFRTAFCYMKVDTLCHNS